MSVITSLEIPLEKWMFSVQSSLTDWTFPIEKLGKEARAHNSFGASAAQTVIFWIWFVQPWLRLQGFIISITWSVFFFFFFSFFYDTIINRFFLKMFVYTHTWCAIYHLSELDHFIRRNLNHYLFMKPKKKYLRIVIKYLSVLQLSI